MWALPSALAIAALAAPLLSGHPLAAWAIREFFSRVCHQEAARSFWIAGAPVAVCARCLGIYLGAAVGAWTGWSRRAAVRFVAVAAVVNGLDVVTETAGLHGNWMDARFVFGAALGLGMAAVVAADAISPRRHGEGRSLVLRGMGMSKRTAIAVVITALISLAAVAQYAPAGKSPGEVVAEYCRLDFDGALTSSDGWPTISPLFVWPDAPGWDTFVVVRSYKVGKEKVTGRFASVVVTYEEVGTLDSTPRFRAFCHRDGYSGGACKVTATVIFHLAYSNKHWVMDKDGNPDREGASGPKVWKINAPQNGPHVSYERALKMAEAWLANASDAETKQKAQQTIEALKRAGE